MMAVSNWAQLYADSLVDVSDIAETVGKAQGGFFQTSRDIAYDGKRWIAMPFTILGVLFANRTSWFADLGVAPDKFPATWDEYRAIGKQLKARNRPYGQTLAHAFGEAGVLVSLSMVVARQGSGLPSFLKLVQKRL